VPDVVDPDNGRDGEPPVSTEHGKRETRINSRFLMGVPQPVPTQATMEKAERRFVEIPDEKRGRALEGSLRQEIDLAPRGADETEGGMLERQMGDEDLKGPPRDLDVRSEVRAPAGEKHLLVPGNRILAQ
jgi:hypothetical protein